MKFSTAACFIGSVNKDGTKPSVVDDKTVSVKLACGGIATLNFEQAEEAKTFGWTVFLKSSGIKDDVDPDDAIALLDRLKVNDTPVVEALERLTIAEAGSPVLSSHFLEDPDSSFEDYADGGMTQEDSYITMMRMAVEEGQKSKSDGKKSSSNSNRSSNRSSSSSSSNSISGL